MQQLRHVKSVTGGWWTIALLGAWTCIYLARKWWFGGGSNGGGSGGGVGVFCARTAVEEKRLEQEPEGGRAGIAGPSQLFRFPKATQVHGFGDLSFDE